MYFLTVLEARRSKIKVPGYLSPWWGLSYWLANSSLPLYPYSMKRGRENSLVLMTLFNLITSQRLHQQIPPYTVGSLNIWMVGEGLVAILTIAFCPWSLNIHVLLLCKAPSFIPTAPRVLTYISIKFQSLIKISSKSDMNETRGMIHLEVKFLSKCEPKKQDQLCSHKNTMVGQPKDRDFCAKMKK